MDVDRSHLTGALDQQACFALLGAHRLGRLAVAGPRLGPLVVPVNYLLDGDVVVFRTNEGTKYELLHAGAVSFEIDGEDEATGTVWSVLLRGLACEAPLRQLRHIPHERLTPDVGGDQDHWIQIFPWSVTGRRYPRVTQTPPPTSRG